MGVQIGSNYDLYWRAGIDTSGFDRGVSNIQGGMGRMTSSSALMVAGWAAVGTALVAAGSAAYNFANEYRDAMLEVKTITGQTDAEFEKMSDSVIELSKDVPIAAEEMAKGLYQIVSAGYDGADGLKVLEVASKAAVGGITDTATAADGLTTVLNSFGLEASDAASVADTMFTTVKLGKTTFGELASSLSNVSSIAASSGISFEEISAAIATLTKSGVPTAQAITQIRSAILSTTEVLGDGAFKANTMQEAFAKVSEQAGGSQQNLRKMLGRVEALNAVLGLTGKNAKTAADDLLSIQDAAGSADKAFQTMMDSNSNQIDIFLNKIKAASKDIGDLLVRAMGGLARAANEALTKQTEGDIFKKLGINPDNISSIKEMEDAIKKVEDRANTIKTIMGVNRKTDSNTFRGDGKVSSFGSTNNVKYTKELGLTNKAVKQLIDSLEELQIEADALDALGADIEITPFKNADEEAQKAKVSLSSLKQELKNLKTELGAADVGEAGAIQLEINTKLEEITAFEAKAFKRNTEDNIKPIEVKSIILDPSGNKPLDKGLVPVKPIPLPEPEKVSALSAGLDEASSIMYSLSYAAGQFDEELGKTLETTANLTSGVGQIAAGFATGNIAGAVAGAAGIIGTLIGTMHSNQTQMIQQARELKQLYSETSFILKEQQRLYSSGTLNAVDAYKKLDEQIAKTKDSIENFTVIAKKDLSGWKNFWGDQDKIFEIDVSSIEEARKLLSGETVDVDKMKSLGWLFNPDTEFTMNDMTTSLEDLANTGFDMKNLDEIQKLVDEYDKLQEEQKKLNNLITATTSESIAEGIADGFLAGKTSMDDFANDFEKLMQQAIIESFKQQFLLANAQKFQTEFASAVASDGELTSDEIIALRKQYSEMVASGKENYEALDTVFQEATGSTLGQAGTDTPQNGVRGTIAASISESTGNELVGLWTRTSTDISVSLEISRQSLEIQTEIANNTLRSANALEAMLAGGQSDERGLGL